MWDKDLCIQCGKCVMVCPHATIRAKVFDRSFAANAPATFKTATPKWRGMEQELSTLQVAPEDCTGCTLCVEACPVKSKSEAKHKAINMELQAPLRLQEKENWEFFESLPSVDRSRLAHGQVKDIQLLEPLFEFSGACAGCGETPYIKLLTQLFGDRLFIANATGCSSIYGGNLPTTPYTVNRDGRGPSWSNSLFEDNAEFWPGLRLAIDQQNGLMQRNWLACLLAGARRRTGSRGAQRPDERSRYQPTARAGSRFARVLKRLTHLTLAACGRLHRPRWCARAPDHRRRTAGLATSASGGLDHVLASGQNVNILVLDTEVYSNTGGQASKSTPRGAVAKFAAGGKSNSKKDLAMEAVSYGSVYVARVALGGNDTHTIKAFQEAEAYNGPSIILAYSHCIAHGFDLAHGLEQQKAAVQSGYWPLMRYNPDLRLEGKNPFQLDSKAPSIPFKEYAYREARYTMLARSQPEVAKALLAEAQDDVERQWRVYSGRAAMAGRSETPNIAPPEKPGEMVAIAKGGQEQ